MSRSCFASEKNWSGKFQGARQSLNNISLAVRNTQTEKAIMARRVARTTTTASEGLFNIAHYRWSRPLTAASSEPREFRISITRLL